MNTCRHCRRTRLEEGSADTFATNSPASKFKSDVANIAGNFNKFFRQIGGEYVRYKFLDSHCESVNNEVDELAKNSDLSVQQKALMKRAMCANMNSKPGYTTEKYKCVYKETGRILHINNININNNF